MLPRSGSPDRTDLPEHDVFVCVCVFGVIAFIVSFCETVSISACVFCVFLCVQLNADAIFGIHHHHRVHSSSLFIKYFIVNIVLSFAFGTFTLTMQTAGELLTWPRTYMHTGPTYGYVFSHLHSLDGMECYVRHAAVRYRN